MRTLFPTLQSYLASINCTAECVWSIPCRGGEFQILYLPEPELYLPVWLYDDGTYFLPSNFEQLPQPFVPADAPMVQWSCFDTGVPAIMLGNRPVLPLGF